MIDSTVNHQRVGWVDLKKSKTWWRNTWIVPYGNDILASVVPKMEKEQNGIALKWNKFQMNRIKWSQAKMESDQNGKKTQNRIRLKWNKTKQNQTWDQKKTRLNWNKTKIE